MQMKKMTHRVLCAAVVAALTAAADRASGDSFANGTFDIEFVTIGAPGNPPDTTGAPNPAGSVPYVYRIAKFATSTDMVNKANAEGALGITIDNRPSDKPATSVNWFEAARFANWLNTSTNHEPAYKFNEQGEFEVWQPGDAGYDPANPYRSTLAYYFLPNADEYYKAAFYDPVGGVYFDFPTGSDSDPVAVASGTDAGTAVYDHAEEGPADIMQAGGLSPFGTMAQGGNTWEWEETSFDRVNDDPLEARSGRGGSWQGGIEGLTSTFRLDNPPPTNEFNDLSFRIASVPEPSALVLVALGLLILGKRRMGRL